MKNKKLLLSFLFSLALHSFFLIFILDSLRIPLSQKQNKEKMTQISIIDGAFLGDEIGSKKIWLFKKKSKPDKESSYKNKNLEKSLSQFQKKSSILNQKNSIKAHSLSRYMKSLPHGVMSLVDADPVLFYSFIQRSGRKIIPHWIAHLEKLPLDFLFPPYSDEKTTTAQLILNKKGHLIKILLKDSSGIPLLDEAATDALKKASPFLNPPKALIQKDELIYLTYKFHVIWNK